MIARSGTAGTTAGREGIPGGEMVLDDERNRRIVDGYRAVGILLVILFHVLFGAALVLVRNGHPDNAQRLIDEVPGVLNLGWQALGSEVIFLLSGFLISYLLFREHHRTGRICLRTFFIKRASRIVPLYAIALFLYAFSRRFYFEDYFFNVIFLSKVFQQRSYVPVGWSMELMVQMYVILPFLVLLVMRVRWKAALLLGVIFLSLIPRFVTVLESGVFATALPDLLMGSVAITPEQKQTYRDLYYLIWYRATPFLVGTLVGYWMVHARAWWSGLLDRGWSRSLFLGAGLALVLLTGFLPIHDGSSALYSSDSPGFWLWFMTLQRFVFATGCGILVIGTLLCSRGWIGKIGDLLAWKPWGHVSRSIFPIYLFHLGCLAPPAALVTWTIRKENLAAVSALQAGAVFVLGAALSIWIGGIITRKVELPLQARIRRKYLGDRVPVDQSSQVDSSQVRSSARSSMPHSPGAGSRGGSSPRNAQDSKAIASTSVSISPSSSKSAASTQGGSSASPNDQDSNRTTSRTAR